MSRALSRTVLAAVCAALLAVAAQALASRPSPAPSGTWATTHFILHYDPAVNALDYVQAGAADFEEAYAHLVDGPATPNAGLHAPRSGADGKIDVYLTAPPEYPTFTGGMVMQDGAPGWEPYVFMTPGLSRGGFRFRAGHEMAHVIQTWYIDTTTGAWHVKGFLIEGSGDWAADFALSDIDPMDNNIATPWYSLDCYSDACGQGYWQWLFLRHEQERWGDDFMQILYDYAHANPALTPLQSLIDVEANIGPVGNTLSDRYAAFARDIWDPSRWTTGSVAKIRSTYAAAEASVTRATADTGTVTQNIDHLGTRYVHVRNWGDTQPSGPGDRLHVTLTGATWPATGWRLMTRAKGAAGWADVAEPVTATGGTFDVPFDPAVTREVLLPLSNTSTTADARAFGYRVQLVRGTPTPPANDTRDGAQVIGLGEAAATEAVYAGGEGSAEATGCPLAGGATNGVWFRFTPPNRGTYRFDATASDGDVVVSLVRTADGDPAVVTASVLPGLLRVNGRTGQVTLRVRCAASSANCELLVQVRSARRIRVGRRRPAYVVLATKKVAITAGKTMTVTLRLSARMRSLVPRRGRMPVVVRLFSGSRLVRQASATLVRK